jgi:hypothetical protein
MLHFIDDAMRQTNQFILKYKSEDPAKFRELKALGIKESGQQV